MMKKIRNFLWRKKWILVGLVVLIGGYLLVKRSQTPKTATMEVSPEYRDIIQVLNVSGSVDAQEKVRMTFAAPSKLTWLPIKEGDVVKKWQGLAQVDARTLQNQLQIAQNTHGKTFRAFEDTLDSVDYYSDSGLTEAERRTAENAQLDIKSSALTVESADIAVKLAYMSSPINGVVTAIDQKNVGALMLPTDAIEIVNPASVFFSAVVDEEDIPNITASQAATISLDAFSDQTFESKVIRIAFTPSTLEGGGTGYRIWLSLPVDNSKMQYRLGMNGDADILLNKKEHVLAIPINAIIERDGKKYTDIRKNGKVERVEISTGIADENYIEIQSGLTPEDVVVMPAL